MGDEMRIQWYPGHMTKTRRMMQADLKLVDAVCEILDARIPYSSRNPDIAAICGDKPRLVILNRTDLADPQMSRKWAEYFRAHGQYAVLSNCKSRQGVAGFVPALRTLLADKLARYAEKGQAGRPLKAMIVGIPNVGKSTLINQLSGRKGAKAENRPGVTRGKQWVGMEGGVLLLDTPGILWPRFDDPQVGLRLAYTGAVKDQVYDVEELACSLIRQLNVRYPEALQRRYQIDLPPETPGWELLEAAARRRGFLLARGELNTERMAHVLLEEYRSSKLGRFTFEAPGEETEDGTGSVADRK